MPEVLGAIARRHSTRKFLPRPVEPALIELMLEAGRLAPAACNIGHARVLVVEPGEDLEAVRRAAYGIGAVAEAPLVLVLLADTSLDQAFLAQMEANAQAGSGPDFTRLCSGSGNPFQLKVGREWALVNAALAGEHMMLQAVEMGLAGCWVHHADHDDLRAHFNLPGHFAILSLMAIGYPAETLSERATPRFGGDTLRYTAE